MTKFILPCLFRHLAITAACGVFCAHSAAAGTIHVPNSSFETPETSFVDPRIDSWQKAAKPAWYDEGSGFLWDQLVGLFANTTPPDPTHIDNCDGNQAIFIFALPEVSLFQDYRTMDWSQTEPAGEFEATFRPGRSYTLTVGVIGGGGNMTNDVTLDLMLNFIDAAGDRLPVARTTITNTAAAFGNTTQFVDFQVHVPAVKATDPWADRRIGIQLLSTVRPDLAGGYWNVDNIRLEETIEVPNGSFEAPATSFADPRADGWQKTPKPFWYDESGGYLWDQLVGQFANTAPGSADHIANCDGNQAIWLFAVPEVGFFQDYESTDWADLEPDRNFDVRFEVGRSYTLTVGVLGGGGNMLEGVTALAGLYFRDASGNRVSVASTNIVYTESAFTNAENQKRFVDYEVRVPTVRAEDAWANQHIGIQFLSTVQPELAGGYWDLDHVRLVEVMEPSLNTTVAPDGGLKLVVQSAPGMSFEVLSSESMTVPVTDWMSIGTVTNVTGKVDIDITREESAGFYQTRRLP